MGSQEIQNKLWGRQPENWANIQEKTGSSGYEYALTQLELNDNMNLLDNGCGSGLFSDIAHSKGISITGIDACENLIRHAKQRNSDVNFLVGDMKAKFIASACSNQHSQGIRRAIANPGRKTKLP